MRQRLIEKQGLGYQGWDNLEMYESLINHLTKDIVLIDRATRFFRMENTTKDTKMGKDRMQAILVDIANRSMILHNQIEMKWEALHGKASD
jgi:hypothetical protein